MTWVPILFILGVVVTVAVWAMFVYIAVREMKAEMPTGALAPALSERLSSMTGPMKVLLPIDGSEASIAAVQDVANCPLPSDSTIELLYVIHSRLPVIPDFPPWAVTIAAAHGESIRAQTRHAPDVLAAAATRLQFYQRQATIVTKTVEGVPKHEILREACDWGADRIVMGSHGRGRANRAILGSTAAAVAAKAPCTVQIARAPATLTLAMPSANVA
jgi:nucleotide-binding universal stress UspA family protein